jgi:AraC-like DNA-binding protein
VCPEGRHGLCSGPTHGPRLTLQRPFSTPLHQPAPSNRAPIPPIVTNLGELAAACGYSDQAHLIHDFKALTDRLPGDKGSFLNRRLLSEETRVIHRYRR